MPLIISRCLNESTIGAVHFGADDLTALATAAAVIVGGVLALLQISTARGTSRLDHTVGLHREYSGGEIGAARERLTMYMWMLGVDGNARPGCCYQPSWADILPPYSDATGVSEPVPTGERGRFSRYPPQAMHGDPAASPLGDYYHVTRFFERVWATYKAGKLDASLLNDLLGHDIVWWSCLLYRIGERDSAFRAALHRLLIVGARPAPRWWQWSSRERVRWTVRVGNPMNVFEKVPEEAMSLLSPAESS